MPSPREFATLMLLKDAPDPTSLHRPDREALLNDNLSHWNNSPPVYSALVLPMTASFFSKLPLACPTTNDTCWVGIQFFSQGAFHEWLVGGNCRGVFRAGRRRSAGRQSLPRRIDTAEDAQADGPTPVLGRDASPPMKSMFSKLQMVAS